MGITRREALGWIGSVVVGSVMNSPLRLSLAEKSDPVIDLMPFCDTSGYGYALGYDIKKPFVVGGRVYATDSRALVTMESRTGSDMSDLHLPNVEQFPWDEFNVGGWRPLWRHVNELPPEECLDECPACDGLGIEFMAPHWTCKKCGGKGRVTAEMLRSRVDGVLLEGPYLDALKQSGDCDYRFAPYPNPKKLARLADRVLLDREIFIDGFAGGGGASVGIEAALGRQVDVAINHNPSAIAMHMANHPKTKHYCENIWNVDPLEATEGRPVGGAWFSPDCTHFSKARGSKPVRKQIRGLAWVVVRWAELAKPRVMFIENVEEFQTWGPVDRKTGKPIPEKGGVTFELWCWKLRELGYEVEWRVLRACDYGSPTTRKRLFIIARRDGRPIVWPEPTHGSPKQIASELRTRRRCNLRPWRAAADIIDWSIPCHSVFLTPNEAKSSGCKRPLVDKTMARIAEGIRRYVIENPEPFVVIVNHGGSHYRGQGTASPLGTITGKNGYALITPFLSQLQHGGRNNRVDEPHRTITASPKDCNLVVTPFLSSYYGAKDGDHHRGRIAVEPLPTQTAENRFALVSAFLIKHFGGVVGVPARSPFPTITARATQNQIAAACLVKCNHGGKQAFDAREPLRTVVAQGTHHAEVRAFLMRYYGSGHQWADCNAPAPTITAKDRLCLGIVVIAGELYQIVDIGMRMLTPRELFRAQGFPSDYQIDIGINGKPATKSEQVARCGNSVCPQVAEAIVRANI